MSDSFKDWKCLSYEDFGNSELVKDPKFNFMVVDDQKHYVSLVPVEDVVVDISKKMYQHVKKRMDEYFIRDRLKDFPTCYVMRFFWLGDPVGLKRKDRGQTLEKALKEAGVNNLTNLDSHEVKSPNEYLDDLSEKFKKDKDFVDKVLGKK